MTAAAATNPLIIRAGLFTVSPRFDFIRSSHRGRGIVNQASRARDATHVRNEFLIVLQAALACDVIIRESG
jgi:hypothetical protein